MAGRADSLWSLRFDLASAKLLVWMAAVGREADLRREAHLTCLIDILDWPRCTDVAAMRRKPEHSAQGPMSTTGQVEAMVHPTPGRWRCRGPASG